MSNDMGQSQAIGLTVVGVTISLVLWTGLARIAATNERLAASNERLAAAMEAQPGQAARIPITPTLSPPTQSPPVIVTYCPVQERPVMPGPLINPFAPLPRPYLDSNRAPGRGVVTAGRSVRVRERVRPLQQPDW